MIMKNIFGYTFQKLQKGGSLFKDNSSNVTKLKSLISKIEKGQLPVSNPNAVKNKLQEIVFFQQGGRYDNGGLAQRSGTVRTQRSATPNSGIVIDKYRGTRIDNANVKSPYTMGGKAQSQSTINANNQEMDTMSLDSYTSPEQIANDFKSGKLKREQAQLLTQKLMNKYSDTDAFDAIKKGELKRGQSKNIGGYNFTLDQNNKLSADRSALNAALGLDSNLKYNTGEYKGNLEYQGTPESETKKFNTKATLTIVPGVKADGTPNYGGSGLHGIITTTGTDGQIRTKKLAASHPEMIAFINSQPGRIEKLVNIPHNLDPMKHKTLISSGAQAAGAKASFKNENQ